MRIEARVSTKRLWIAVIEVIVESQVDHVDAGVGVVQSGVRGMTVVQDDTAAAVIAEIGAYP